AGCSRASSLGARERARSPNASPHQRPTVPRSYIGAAVPYAARVALSSRYLRATDAIDALASTNEQKRSHRSARRASWLLVSRPCSAGPDRSRKWSAQARADSLKWALDTGVGHTPARRE